MVVPACRAHSVGEVTAWGQQFLAKLKENNVAELNFEPSLEGFCQNNIAHKELGIALVENCPGSMKTIEYIRNSGARCFILWYGRGFNKDELAKAIEYRVFQVLEDLRPDSESVKKVFKAISDSRDRQRSFEQILHSIKTTVIQSESSEPDDTLGSIKAAVTKLENCGLSNEFQGNSFQRITAQEKLPIHKAQGLADSLATVHDLERTGILLVKGNLQGQEGMVEFLQGKIVGAGSGQVHGIKAIYRMFLWDEPKFIFTKKDPDDFLLEEHLTVAMKYIRDEGERLQHRFEQLRKELPPKELRLELDPGSFHSGVKLSHDDFSTLSSIIEFGKVSQVLDFNDLPDVNIYESLIRLKKTRMIRVAA